MYWWLTKAIASVAFWMLLLWADPFGIESATEKASIDLFQRVVSPFYSTAGQDKVRVVLISDEDLPLGGVGPAAWPPSYEDYVKLLNGLGGTADYRPSAIFLDILFENVPMSSESIVAFCAKAAEISNAGTPVIFAALPNDTFTELRRPSALQLCREMADDRIRLASVGWRAVKGLYPFGVVKNSTSGLTAAAALYDTALRTGSKSDLERQAAFEAQIKANEQMRIVWGASLPLGARPSQGACENDYRGGFAEKLSDAAKIFLNGLIPHRARRDAFRYPQTCAFHETISARTLMEMSASERDNFAASIDGAYILVGADVDGIPDFVDSPVHGRLPGVFVHAMALDNLLALEDQYLRDAKGIELPFGGFELSIDVILQAAALFTLALALAYFRVRKPARLKNEVLGKRDATSWVRGLATNFVIGAVFTICVLILAFVTYGLFRWTPLNYGAVLLAGAGMIFSNMPTTGARETKF